MVAAVLAFLGAAALRRFLVTSAIVFALGAFSGGYAVWTLWGIADNAATIAALRRDLDAAKDAASLAETQVAELREIVGWNTRVTPEIERETERAPVVENCVTPGFLDGLRKLK